MSLNIIVAVDKNYGIGKNSTIPWIGTKYFSMDMKIFKALTCSGKNPLLVMGKTTYKSCGTLAGREKIMVSSTSTYKSVADVLEKFPDRTIWICGGRNVYLEALSLNPSCIYITHIPEEYECDVSMYEFANVPAINIMLPK